MRTDPDNSPQADAEASLEPNVLVAAVRFFHVVNRYRMIVILSVIAALCLATIYHRRIPRQYQSSASLMIRQVTTDADLASKLAAHGLLSSYKQLLLSDPVLISTVENLDVRPPELAGKRERSGWPGALRGMLSVSFATTGNVLQVTCRSTDPESTVRVIKALTASSSKYMEGYQQDVSFDLVQKLDNERRELEHRLFTRERELLQARKECGDISVAEGSENSHPIVQRVTRLSEELTKVKRQRLELEGLWSSVNYLVQTGADLSQALQKLSSIVGTRTLSRIPGSGVESAETVHKLETELEEMQAELAALQRHYGSGHADIIHRTSLLNLQYERLKAARQDLQRQISIGIRDPLVGQWMLDTLRAELTSTLQYEGLLQEEYNKAEQHALALSDKLADIRVAERELGTLRQLHTSLLNRLNSIDIGSGEGTFRVAVLTEPLKPSSPVYPNFNNILLCFCGAAVALSLGVIYVIDLLDDRLRSPEEVQEQLGLPILAVTRRLTEAGQTGVQVHDFPQSAESECYRTLKTALEISAEETACVAVTSAESAEGKTTLCVNLAAAYAQTGKRTLLIDADMRRPGLSRLLDVRTYPGLSEALRAESGVAAMCDERVVRTAVPTLDVLPCGPRIQNAGTLLSMPTLADVLDWAASQYDQVFVDCPPILAVSDAAIIGRHVDGMVFLLDPGKSHRRSILRAVHQLRSLHMNLLGVVVNATFQGEGSGYGYGYGYGYAYGYGYGAAEAYAEDDENDGAAADEVILPMPTREPVKPALQKAA